MTPDLLKAIKDIATSNGGVDIWIYGGNISRSGADQILDSLPKEGHEALLILATTGGDPDGAFRIARTFQARYKHFRVYIPTRCKSAGTLVVLGAEEIILRRSGELGPLDIQLGKTDEIFEMVSGLNISEAINSLGEQSRLMFRTSLLEMRLGSQGTVSTRLAAEIACSLTTGLFGPIFSQIDPFKVGETERAMKIAYSYGERLDSKFQNLKSKDALGRLVGGYPSHSFVIDFEEAETLFNRVRFPKDAEIVLAESLKETLRSIVSNEDATILCLNNLIAEAENEENASDNDQSENEPSESQEGTARSDSPSDKDADRESGNVSPANRGGEEPPGEQVALNVRHI